MGARMSTLRPAVCPGGTVNWRWTGEYMYIFVPPTYVNTMLAGYHVAEPVFLTFQLTVKRSPGLNVLPSATLWDTTWQLSSLEPGPVGVMDGSVKIKGVKDGRAIAVLDGWMVGVSVGGLIVAVAEGLGDDVG